MHIIGSKFPCNPEVLNYSLPITANTLKERDPTAPKPIGINNKEPEKSASGDILALCVAYVGNGVRYPAFLARPARPRLEPTPPYVVLSGPRASISAKIIRPLRPITGTRAFLINFRRCRVSGREPRPEISRFSGARTRRPAH